MRGIFPCIFPYAFNRIVIRRVRRQLKNFDLLPVFLEKFIDFRLFMVRCVVLNKVESFPFLAKGFKQHVIQKVDVAFRIEILSLMSVGELSVVETYGAKNFLGVSVSVRKYFGLIIPARPCSVQCRILPERRFVSVNDQRVFRAGVFFRLGYVYLTHLFLFDSLAPARLIVGC